MTCIYSSASLFGAPQSGTEHYQPQDKMTLKSRLGVIFVQKTTIFLLEFSSPRVRSIKFARGGKADIANDQVGDLAHRESSLFQIKKPRNCISLSAWIELCWLQWNLRSVFFEEITFFVDQREDGF